MSMNILGTASSKYERWGGLGVVVIRNERERVEGRERKNETNKEQNVGEKEG